MHSTFGIVDLFAGPGGLGEGFASFVEEGHSPFRIGISIEMDASAHRTLTLRAFLREYQARHGILPEQFIDFHAGIVPEPDWTEVDASAWQLAVEEARGLELGTDAATTAIDAAIAKLKIGYDDTILIGGPSSRRPLRFVAHRPPCWHIAMPSGEGGNHPICRERRPQGCQSALERDPLSAPMFGCPLRCKDFFACLSG